MNYPAIGEVFKLTATESIEGLAMVKAIYINWLDWKFNGEVLLPCTKHFKLIQINYQPNFESIQHELKKYGVIPQGQWCDIFRKKYQKPDGKGPIGVLDASWILPKVSAFFPCLDMYGDSDFWETYNIFGEPWRGLVKV